MYDDGGVACGTKLNGMHATSVVISHRFAEFNGQNVIPSNPRICVQKV